MIFGLLFVGVFAGAGGAFLAHHCGQLMGTRGYNTNSGLDRIGELKSGQVAEISGTAFSPNPVTAVSVGKPAVFLINQEFQNNINKRANTTSMRTDVKASSSGTLYIDDGTGKIRVNMQLARYSIGKLGDIVQQPDGLKVAAELVSQRLLSFGHITTGTKIIEKGILPGKSVYAFGRVSAEEGSLVLTDQNENNAFVTDEDKESFMKKRVADLGKWKNAGLGIAAFGAVAFLMGLLL